MQIYFIQRTFMAKIYSTLRNILLCTLKSFYTQLISVYNLPETFYRIFK